MPANTPLSARVHTPLVSRIIVCVGLVAGVVVLSKTSFTLPVTTGEPLGLTTFTLKVTSLFVVLAD